MRTKQKGERRQQGGAADERVSGVVARSHECLSMRERVRGRHGDRRRGEEEASRHECAEANRAPALVMCVHVTQREPSMPSSATAASLDGGVPSPRLTPLTAAFVLHDTPRLSLSLVDTREEHNASNARTRTLKEQ